MAMAAASAFVFFFAAVVMALAAAGSGDAAFVEHTFVVSQMKLRHLCNDTLVIVVNGQLPGPTIEVREGDSVAVHVINKSPYGVTIHWHGVKQQLNCWADGAGMITQCPIQPSKNFTYRFDVKGQEGTLWWHAHVACLRATLHGAFIVLPRSGPSSYPFPKPRKEIPIVIGEWWEMDLVNLYERLESSIFDDWPRSATINGKLGDLNNCSGSIEENYVLNVEQRKTYLLRIVNAALHSEYYLKIAGHMFTVVAADASYVKPYTTDTIAIAPGETVDALVVTDAPPGRYYMVAMAIQSPKPIPQIPVFFSRGIIQYKPVKVYDSTPILPEMPNHNEQTTSFYFRGNLTANLPRHPRLSPDVDERVFIALDAGFICREGGSSCSNVSNMVAMMNNVSFQLPATVPLLQAHYYGNMSSSSIPSLQEFPQRPPRMFNYSKTLEPTLHATTVRRLRYNTTVEIVFQSPAMADSYSNPMHLHGHDFFVLAQGLGKYDLDRDMRTYNLVDPPLRNTVLVPVHGWAVIRFVTNNPGVWFLHCHYEQHVSGGMATTFVVEDGPTVDTTLPPPPENYPSCDNLNSRVAYE